MARGQDRSTVADRFYQVNQGKLCSQSDEDLRVCTAARKCSSTRLRKWRIAGWARGFNEIVQFERSSPFPKPPVSICKAYTRSIYALTKHHPFVLEHWLGHVFHVRARELWRKGSAHVAVAFRGAPLAQWLERWSYEP